MKKIFSFAFVLLMLTSTFMACDAFTDVAKPAATFTVTYNSNGAETGTVPVDTGKYEKDASVTVKSTGDLSLTDYSFGGWNTKADGNGIHYNAGDTFSMPESNITLYAVWDAIPRYTVTYTTGNATSGTAPTDSLTYLVGATVTVLSNSGNLAIENQAFAGWTDGNGGTLSAGSTFMMPSQNVSLSPVFIPDNSAIVIYNSNGATGTVSDSNSYAIGATATVKDANSLTYTDYKFTGWNTLQNGNGTLYNPGDSLNITTSTTVLYAQWEKIVRYSVSYTTGSAESGTAPVDSTMYQEDDEVTILNNSGSLSRPNYTFAGWSNGAGSTLATGAKFKMPAKNVIFTPVFIEDNKAIIIYHSNGATGTVTDTNTYTIGSTATVKDASPLTFADHNFTGWNTQEDGNGTHYAPGASLDVTAATIELYAEWEKIARYSVTYTVGTATSGTVPQDSSTYPAGSTVTVLGNTGTLALANYTFSGWKDTDGTSYNADATFSMPAKNVTLEAQFTENDYSTITYNSNGATGTVTDGTKYYAGVSATVSNGTELSNTGYTFTGWNTKADGTGTAYRAGVVINSIPTDLELFARWKDENDILRDGSFEYIEGEIVYDAANWEFYEHAPDGITGTAEVINNQAICELTTIAADPQPWQAQLFQRNLTFEANAIYTITFNAYADAAKNIDVQCTEQETDRNGDGNLFTQYISKQISLTTTDQQYTFDFSMPEYSDETAGLLFCLGSDKTTAYISNVSLIKTGTVPVKTVTYKDSLSSASYTATFYKNLNLPTADSVQLTNTGKVLTGWNTKADDTGIAYIEGSVIEDLSADIELYARWQDADEMLTNGSFDYGTAGWWFWNNNIAENTCTLNNGTLDVSIGKADSGFWDTNWGQSNLLLEANGIYTFSFKLKTAVARDVFVEVNENGIDRNGDDFLYSGYALRPVRVTPDVENYTIQFAMPNYDDPTAKVVIHFTNSVMDVSIDDISLKKTGEYIGNELIRNGNLVDGECYWFIHKSSNIDATVAIENQEIFAKVNSIGSTSGENYLDIRYQDLDLQAGYTYTLTFSAKSSIDNRQIAPFLSETRKDIDGDGAEWSPYNYDNITLSTVYTEYTMTFPMYEYTDPNASLCFSLAWDDGDVYIKNVSMTKTAIPVPTVGENHINWGAFDNSQQQFSTYSSETPTSSFSVAGDTGIADLTSSPGATLYDRAFYNNNEETETCIQLIKGKKYRLSFDVSADTSGTIAAGVGSIEWDDSFGGKLPSSYTSSELAVATTPTNVSFEFTADRTDYSADLIFYCGGQSRILTFDNVEFVEIN